MEERNITQEIYNFLEEKTNDLEESKELIRSANAKISSGKYTYEGQKEIKGEIDRLRRSIDSAVYSAMEEAKKKIEDYRKEVRDANRLDSAQITDDIKLLSPGIVLKTEDIEAMLERNADNKTMLQIILRYAKEKGIAPKGTYYVGGQKEIETANGLEGILYYYEKWMKDDKALTMLNKFFTA